MDRRSFLTKAAVGGTAAAAGAKENCPVSQALKAVPIELTILD